MPAAEQVSLTNLHLCVTNAPLKAIFSTAEAVTQANLRTDVKALVAEYLAQLGAPALKPEAWREAQVEIVSEDTLSYLQQMEGLLEDVLADPDTNEELAARIEAILR